MIDDCYYYTTIIRIDYDIRKHIQNLNPCLNQAPREKRKLQSTVVQKLTYGVIRKFEDGAGVSFVIVSLTSNAQTDVPRCSISMLLTILYITRWLLFSPCFFYCPSSSNSDSSQSLKSTDDISSCGKKGTSNNRLYDPLEDTTI